MYKSVFKELAERENGKFYYQDKDISIGMGVRSPSVIYKVVFSYKKNEFVIINKTGTNFIGTIRCKLSKTIQPIPFEINSISLFKYFLFRKKSRLRAISDNDNIIHFLNNNDYYGQLGQIAINHNFYPSIICKKEDSWDITSTYHLEFDNWTQVLEPTIQLFKDLIDEFEQRIANISNTAYRDMSS